MALCFVISCAMEAEEHEQITEKCKGAFLFIAISCGNAHSCVYVSSLCFN